MQIISKNFITKFKFLKLKEKIKNLMLFRQNKYLDHKMQNITKEEIYTFINFFPKYRNKFNIEKLNKNFFLIKKLNNEL